MEIAPCAKDAAIRGCGRSPWDSRACFDCWQSAICINSFTSIIERGAYGQSMGDSTQKALEAVTQELQKLDPTTANAADLVSQGRQIFRFDTFGDEAFWGDKLQLHLAIEGIGLGGIGPGLSPKGALAAGLKIDVDALPRQLRTQLSNRKVNLDDPTVTLALLKLNAVIGVTGFFNSSGTLRSVGLQCSFCHSTVDNSHPALCAGAIDPNPGTGCVGHRLDGWPNRDLNVGGIVALAPDLSPFASLLGISQDTVRTVLNSWGPGKFDAELFLDGKAFNPQRVTDGAVTGTNVPGATMIPPAFGLGGVNLHTWTGWGSVPHWNALVANLELHGTGIVKGFKGNVDTNTTGFRKHLCRGSHRRH